MAKAKKLKPPRPKTHDKTKLPIETEINFQKLLKLPLHEPAPKKKS